MGGSNPITKRVRKKKIVLREACPKICPPCPVHSHTVTSRLHAKLKRESERMVSTVGLAWTRERRNNTGLDFFFSMAMPAAAE
jgi:hypothetical protein